MAEQLIDFAIHPETQANRSSGKDGPYHLGLCRRILKYVHKETPTQRKFAAWLRQNQVYDRALLQFALKLCDVKVGKTATLGDVGQELAEEVLRGGSEIPSAPEPDPASGGDGGDGEGLEGEEGERPERAAKPAPTATAPARSSFDTLIFDRFVELNGYLVRFVFCEVADGFLAPTEMIKRLSSAIYHGTRVQVASFQGWLKWMEWLGYVKPVGFRHKLTELGIDAWKYLKEIPEEELLEKGTLGVLSGMAEEEAPKDERPFITAEDLPKGAAPAVVPVAEPPGAKPAEKPAAAPPTPGGDPGDETGVAAPEDRELLEEEGLDLPPEAVVSPAPSSEDETLTSAEEEEAIQELFGGEAAAPEAPPRAEAPAPPGAAPPMTSPVPSAPLAPPAKSAPPPPPVPLPPQKAGAPAASPAPAAPKLAEQATAAIRPPPPTPSGSAARHERREGRRVPAKDACETVTGIDVEDDDLAALSADVGESAKRVSPAEAAAARSSAEDDAAPPPVLDVPPKRPERLLPGELSMAERLPEALSPGELSTRERLPSVRSSRGGDLGRRVDEDEPLHRALRSAPLADAQGDLLAAQWEVAPGRGPLGAADLGLEERRDDRAHCLFKLAAAAALMEGPGPYSAKLALIGELEGDAAFDELHRGKKGFEQVLEDLGLVGGPREIGALEERLIHLPRLRRALAGEELLSRIEAAGGRRAAVIRAAFGSAVGAGAYWIEREMRRLGAW